MKFGPDGDITGGVAFFEKPLLETGRFRATVSLAILTFVSGALVLDGISRGNSVPGVALAICVCLGAVLLFWRAALCVHRRIHDLFVTGKIKDIQPGGPLEIVLRSTAGMTLLGLLYVSGLTCLLILELGRSLKHR